MRRIAAIFLTAALLVPAGATAHHVPVTAVIDDSDSDSVALDSYITEYSASFGAVIAALTRYVEIVDSDRLVLLENSLITGIEHLTSLDARTCFSEMKLLSIADFEAAVVAITAHKVSGGDIDFTAANIAHGLAVNAAIAAVASCANPVLPSDTEALV